MTAETERATDEIALMLYEEPRTRSLQVSIEDAHSGFRIAGPKFIGESRLLRRIVLDPRTAREMERYLERVQ